MLPNLTASDLDWIWARVAPPDDTGCRYWTGRTNDLHYGVLTLGRQRWYAHRLIFLLSGGQLTANKPNVCHHCNHPRCCAPDHLYADDQAGNLGYMTACGRNGSQTHPESRPRGDTHWARTHPERLARGTQNGAHTHPERRARGPRHAWYTHPELIPRGERHGRAKLTTTLILEIRERARGGESFASIARTLGVYKGTVGRIVQGKTWRHVT